MTIIQPSKKENIARLIGALSLLVAVVVGASVMVYAQTTALRYDIQALEKDLENIRVENAELKDTLYDLVDVSNLEKLAYERGLIQETNPQWAFVSQP